MTTLTSNTFLPDYASPPGDTLLEALEERSMSQAEFANRTGRSKKTINEIIQGKAPITPETALQFERVLNIPATFWNRREQQYREALARLEDDKHLSRWTHWLKVLPLKDMFRRGWIQEHSDPVDQVRELLRYFQVASPEAWQTIWEQEVVAYRKSQSLKSDFARVAVWLRQGEIEAQGIDCEPFDAKIFREALSHVRKLTVEPPEMLPTSLVNACAHAGVAVTFVRELPKTGISGATRWLSPQKALIQLSLRYRTDDQLWFTFFHEAAHILLHGKRDVFLEQDSDAREERQQSSISVKEREADEFAAEFLVPQNKWNHFKSTGRGRSKSGIVDFAAEMGVAPGIVVGRLQHEGILPFTHCNELKRRLTWADDESAT